MSSPKPLFQNPKPVIAMIHLGALPGTSASKLSLVEIEKQALREAKIFRQAGVHGVMLENMHDTPYLRGSVGPEIVASMAIIARTGGQVSIEQTASLQIQQDADRFDHRICGMAILVPQPPRASGSQRPDELRGEARLCHTDTPILQ